ncbi:amino acid permease [Risungbinella massiliensis]|uniref:amino acid permease n=1 Tax=Risungbinella massiliensis TaxID=1329796 RepID=UPI0005CC88D8|nr:amino acid permease [Risungbinella massiliensis]
MRETKEQHSENLTRDLKDRHIQLIAIGGAIGVGLFLGSAKAIKAAGPALALSYIIGGIAIFFIMRALGELAIYRPISGSFSAYADEFVGPWAGFITGWTYWFMWVTIVMAEATAIGLYVKYWFPQVPQWLAALLSIIVVYLINLLAVKVFGELEFWFALIKIVTILLLIVVGLTILLTGWGDTPVGFSNLWTHGGFFPNGTGGMLFALQMVMFAFIGVELIGVTAGETEDPEKNIPSAVNNVLWRILIFYVGALVVIMALYPWNQISEEASPFVLTFSRIGIPAAAGIINFVVITAALSSANSGIFSTGRMLMTLAKQNQAPKAMGKVSKQHVPSVGITASSIVLLVGVLLNFFIPEEAFVYITSVGTVGALWTWGMILYTHIKYREAVKAKRVPESNFKMPGAPFTNWIVLIYLLVVTIMLWFDPDTRIALIIGPIWFLILIISYQFVKKRQNTNQNAVR